MSWTKDGEGTAWLSGHDDVSVIFSEDWEGRPFVGAVGNAKGVFPTLPDAMDWCEEVARGRAILKSPEPFDQSDEAYDDFLEQRGLTES
jgi:hypothetical protein